MPQPFNRIVPNPTVRLHRDALADKPEMAALVTEIFAIWSSIEADLSTLLAKILGTSESPAFAIYSVLTAQHLQSKALEAAARAALAPDQYDVFLAAMTVVQSAQSPRNRLAHWLWGTCAERPDLLALADPKMIRSRILRINDHVGRYVDQKDFLESLKEGIDDGSFAFDTSAIVGVSKGDLERSRDDLLEAEHMLLQFQFYLHPQLVHALLKRRIENASVERTRATILDLLNDGRLFREALARIRADRQSTP